MIDPLTEYILKKEGYNRKLNEFGAIDVLIPIVIIQFFVAYFKLAKKIQPLINRENKELSNRLKEIVNDGTPWRVFVIDMKYINAFACGNPDIMITKGLEDLYKTKPRWVESVLLHEVSHVKNFDLLKISFPFGSLLYSLILLLKGHLPIFMPLSMLFILSALVLGRRGEIAADKFVIKYGYRKDSIEFFKYIKKEKEKNKEPKSFELIRNGIRKLQEYLDVHPTLESRIKYLMQAKNIRKIMAASNLKDMTMKVKNSLIKGS